MRHFLKPKNEPGYICPAGPRLRPIPVEGQWYEMTSYLHRRVLCGDARMCDDEAPNDNLPAVVGGVLPAAAPVRVGSDKRDKR